MIKIEKTDVFGWESAIRGMRNPMNSWDKSDSEFPIEFTNDIDGDPILSSGRRIVEIGENDLKLMKSLSKAGSDHAKFLRMINVTVDITAPLYWWKEFDTYKVGTVANSCSTMHKIHAKEFEMDDFSREHLMTAHTDSLPIEIHAGRVTSPLGILQDTIFMLNKCRELFLATKDKKYWWQMIQILPTSYNQKRTVQLNYQVLKSMYFARRTHKLDEWVDFCKWVEEIPYFKEICIQE